MSTTIDRVHSAQKSGGGRGAERTRGLNSVGGIVLLALGLLVAPVCSTAQQAAHIPRVGFLDPGHPGHRLAFRQGLHAFGYVEGETVIVERRSWEGRPERAPELIAELVRLKVDVLVIAGSRLVTVAKEVTTTLPIVVIAGGDPVTTGLIASFARSGGNITGLTVHHPELSGKTLELLKETIPHLSRVAALWEARGDPAAVRQMESAAQALGLSLQVLTVRAPDEFPRAFQAAIEGHAEALHLSESAMLDAHLPQFAAFAAQRRLPTMGQLRLSAEAGFLMSYGPDVADLFRRAAHLRREDPAWGEAGGPAGGAADEVCAGDQPQDRPGTRDHGPRNAPVPGGRGDQVGVGIALARGVQPNETVEKVQFLGFFKNIIL